MKKLILFCSISLFLLVGLNAQKGHFSLIGKTNNIPDNTMIFMDDAQTNERIDSAVVLNNQFSFKGMVDTYKEIFLFTQFNGEFQHIGIYLEPTDMTFDASQTNFLNAKITGSKLQKQSDELRFQLAPLVEKAMNVNQQIFKIYQTQGDTTGLTQLQREQEESMQKSNEITKRFIADHPDYLESVKSLVSLKDELPKSEVKMLYTNLSSALKNTEYAQSIKFWLEASIDLNIGDKAPNFELPDLQNEKISLSNYTGKYVLLEFGASNCGSCRQENPNLLKAYQKYQNKGFEILSVWLDKNQKNWANTVEKDQMIWTSVCDLKGSHGEVPILYNVTFLPTNYLLDKKGTVIAKNLRGEQLEEALAELFYTEMKSN